MILLPLHLSSFAFLFSSSFAATFFRSLEVYLVIIVFFTIFYYNVKNFQKKLFHILSHQIISVRVVATWSKRSLKITIISYLNTPMSIEMFIVHSSQHESVHNSHVLKHTLLPQSPARPISPFFRIPDSPVPPSRNQMWCPSDPRLPSRWTPDCQPGFVYSSFSLFSIASFSSFYQFRKKYSFYYKL